MERKVLKNKREQLRRGKKTLFKKAHRLSKAYDIDIAIIMHKNGQYFTYRSVDRESWPPTMKQIVRRNPLSGLSMIDLMPGSKLHILSQRTYFRMTWRISRSYGQCTINDCGYIVSWQVAAGAAPWRYRDR
jgi:hypothetical protein